ncbi:hypothetical protein DM558_04345 [Entomomonas moraniae]|uniref:Uncharacterized protein n=1 Tax=Entomomonas moraniae TaxID=2213226 RepID=A0A3Q9JK40_9GAMM|nr:hypothetical protein [Entomomonas moraniae]AZS50052.1 hypothetical protein DM558_04345 [Entomomonas moraniae]
MIGLKALFKMEYFFNKVFIACLIIFLFYCQNYPFTINSNQLYKITIPFLLLLVIAEIRVKMKGELDRKLKITIKPEQYEKISEIVQKKNITVDQFCIEVIDEKLDKSI